MPTLRHTVRSSRRHVALILIAACAAPRQEGIDPSPVLNGVEVNPAAVTIGASDSAQFQATGRMSDGSTRAVGVTWSAGGGSVSAAGLYHPSGTPGTYLVIARTPDQSHADTAGVTVSQTPVPVTLTGVTLTPGLDTLAPGGSQAFSAVGHYSNGVTDTVSVAWTATGGTISSGGVYQAGATVGTYRVIATALAAVRADTAVVVIRAVPTLTGVVVTPAVDTLLPGAQRTFVATAQYSNGTTGTATVTWTATGGSVNTSGRYTAGATPGSFRVIATTTTGGFADTSSVVIKAPTLSAVVVAPASATVDPGSATPFTATGQFSDGSSGPVTVTWTATGGTVTSGGVYTAGATAGTYRVVATATTASLADTSQVTIRDTTTPPGGGVVLLSETFDDANVGPRGWYANTDPAIATTGQHAGAGALELHWTPGSTLPVKGVSLRHLFTGSNTLYVRYWVKYSSNFVGSGLAYHPHEFTVLTSEDGQWIGPSRSHLGLLIEHNWQNGGGYPRLSAGDALNIDVSKILVDLSNVTESRATQGCNGETDHYPTGCYQIGTEWFNQKEWTASTPSMTSTAGAANKTNWHKVEVFFQLNTIVGGKGQSNGVAQFRVDGQLKLDLQNVLFRTAAFPNMQFNQFLVAGYIGDGSPVDQTMWIDDLVVATAPVP